MFRKQQVIHKNTGMTKLHILDNCNNFLFMHIFTLVFSHLYFHTTKDLFDAIDANKLKQFS